RFGPRALQRAPDPSRRRDRAAPSRSGGGLGGPQAGGDEALVDRAEPVVREAVVVVDHEVARFISWSSTIRPLTPPISPSVALSGRVDDLPHALLVARLFVTAAAVLADHATPEGDRDRVAGQLGD